MPIGFGGEQEFLKLITQQPAWAPDLPIAANAWRGPRYGKSSITLEETAARWTPRSKDETPIKYWGNSKAAKRSASKGYTERELAPRSAWVETDAFRQFHPLQVGQRRPAVEALQERPADNSKVPGSAGPKWRAVNMRR